MLAICGYASRLTGGRLASGMNVLSFAYFAEMGLSAGKIALGVPSIATNYNLPFHFTTYERIRSNRETRPAGYPLPA